MSSTTDRVSGAIVDETAEWFQIMRDGEAEAATRQQFADWLAASPLHLAEYLQMTELWADLGQVDAERRIDVQSLIDDALRHHNVEAMEPMGQPQTEPRQRSRWRLPLAVAAAAALLAGFLWFSGVNESQAVYTTERGEQRSFALDDGTLIHLNTQSTIRVRLGRSSRQVELSHGEALFDVAEDASRPFIVSDSHAVAVALGTQFNVYRREDSTQVTVLEGSVAVSHKAAGENAADPGRIELGAGEQASVGARGNGIKAVTVDVEQITAWTSRRLIFREETLRHIIAEFNRYNPTELTIADDELATQRISASFNADDPQSLVDVLRNLFDVAVAEQPDGTLLLTLPGDR